MRKTPRFALLTWMLLLVVLPAGAYMLHVYDQLEEGRQINLRTLAKASQTTTSILASSIGTVRNLGKNIAFTCEFIRRQTRLRLAEDCATFKNEKSLTKTPTAAFAPAKLEITLAWTRPVVFGVRLDGILGEIPFGNALDLVLVVNEQGKVIRTHEPRGRIGGGLVLNGIEDLMSYDEALTKERLPSSSSVRKVRLAGADYDLLCQPLSLEFDGSPGGTWALCGLLSSQRALRDSLEVAPLLAMLMLAMVVFGALTWPILKMFGQSQRERLWFGDLYFLLFGTWGTLMVAVILLLGLDTHRALREESESSLVSLAEKVEGNLLDELHDLQVQLVAYDHKMAEEYRRAPGRFADDQLVQAMDLLSGRPRDVATSWLGLPARLLENGSMKSDFEVVFWMRPCDGLQFAKGTIRNDNSAQLTLDYRKYFQAVQRGALWYGDRFVEPVRSATTGEFRTVLSIESEVPWRVDDKLAGVIRDRACPPNSKAVAAIQTRLISTSAPILGPGVGFAIIDTDGNVAFHSNEQRALFENLYDEMSAGTRLAGLVRSGVDGAMNSYYLGRPHQVVVHPVQSTPWSIVAFSDDQTLDTSVLETLADALAFALAYLAAGLVLALIHLGVRGQEGLRSLWPDADRARLTRVAIGVAFGGAAALAMAVVWLEGSQLLLVATSLPLAVVAVVYGCSRWVPPGGAGTRRIGLAHLRRSVAFSLLLWVVIALLPAYGFYRVAFDHALPLLVKHENASMAEQIAQRNCAIDDYYKGVDLYCPTDAPDGSVCVGGALDDRHGQLGREFYRSTMFKEREQRDKLRSEVKPQEWYWSFLGRYKPSYNETVTRFRSLDSNRQWLTSGIDWHFESQSSFPYPFACQTVITALESRLPLSVPPIGGVTVLGGIALIALLTAWVRYAVRRIFFGELEAPALIDATALDEMMRVRAGNLPNRIVALIAAPQDRERFVPAAKEPLLEADAAVGYLRCDLERCLRAGAQGSLLARLEKAVGAQEDVLIVTRSDFAELSNAPPSADEAPAQPAPGAKPAAGDADRRRWSELVQEFRTVVVALERTPLVAQQRGPWRRDLDKPAGDAWWTAELEPIPELRAMFGGAHVQSSRREALEKIVEKAEALYRALWNACSPDEKLVLIQLVQENIVNPKQALTVRRLLQRGFVRRDPVLQPMNQSFALFVSREQDPAEVSSWEHSDERRWDQMRWVLFGGLAVLLLFLWATQRDVFNSGVALLSGAALGIPGVLKALETLTKLGARPAPTK